MHEVYGGDWLGSDLSYRGGSLGSGSLNAEPDLYGALQRELANPGSFTYESWLLSGMSYEERWELQDQQRLQRERNEQKLSLRVPRAGASLLARIRGALGS